MSDERLRELERRARATRGLEDEVAFLSARLRAGLVPQERVELAALIGVESARGALGRAVAATTGPGSTLEEVGWSATLVTSFQLLRSALQLRLLLARVPIERALHGPADPAVVQRLDAWVAAIEDRALCPCDAHRAAAASLHVAPALDMPSFHVAEGASALAAIASRDGAVIRGRPGLAEVAAASDMRERMRAWCLGEPLPIVDAEAERARTAEQLLLQFGALFALSTDVWLSATGPARPSFLDPARRIVPVLACAGPHRAQFARRFGLDPRGRTRRVPAAELLHDLLPRWASDGLLVAPIADASTSVVEVEPLALQGALRDRLPRDVVEEHRQHMAWVARREERRSGERPRS